MNPSLPLMDFRRSAAPVSSGRALPLRSPPLFMLYLWLFDYLLFDYLCVSAAALLILFAAAAGTRIVWINFRLFFDRSLLYCVVLVCACYLGYPRASARADGDPRLSAHNLTAPLPLRKSTQRANKTLIRRRKL